MRPRPRPVLGLVASVLLPALAASAAETPAKLPKHAGAGAGYLTLGDLPVLHVEDMGSRVKPLDTYARQNVREVYGRDAIRLLDREGELVQDWSALGAFVDWPVRPGFWDDQEIILIDMFDYRPFKQMLLRYPIRRALESVADKATTPEADRARIAALLEKETIAEADLAGLLDSSSFPEADRALVEGWAAKLAEGRKWIAPGDLEGTVVNADGHEHSFMEWFFELYDRGATARRNGETFEPTALEQKAIDVGQRLVRYMSYRERNARTVEDFDLLVIPRPYGPEYLKFTGAIVRRIADERMDREILRSPRASEEERSAAKARSDARPQTFSPLEKDAYNVLEAYLEDIKTIGGYIDDVALGKRKPPGEDEKFDRSFAAWLRDKSAWVPLRVVLGEDLGTLALAGFPRDKVESFRSAYEALQSAEASAPGQLDRAPASAFVAAARALGTATNPEMYPPTWLMARESHFNRFAPFVKAPMAYGVALVLLLISLGIPARPGTALRKVDLGLYGLGMLAFVAGLGLEVYGFFLRVTISGWAPVTNMYETVVWVAAVAAVLGLVLELIFRKKYAIVAASGMALLGTLLAANVPLLDGDIRQLTPVLRDNYWLTVHVLTIVSSYAAFTLALGLGLLALGYYLSATYRRDVGYLQAASPILLGLPLAALGGFGWWMIATKGAGTAFDTAPGYALVRTCAGAGWLIAVCGLSALLGEFSNRNPRSALGAGLLALAVGAFGVLTVLPMSRPEGWAEELPLTFIPGLVAVGGFALAVLGLLGGQSRRVLRQALALEAGDEAIGVESPGISRPESGGVATLARPTVAEIRARAAASRPKLDPRGQAMQLVAGQVKPMTSFLYRAMQVGVLLVAAGTILGGVWADVSWGRFWGWDAKEVWALITLLVYLVPLHGRFAGWVSTFGLVFASVVCYMAVLMAWYGVNFVLGVGLHSYGFTKGGGQYLVITCALAMIGVATGAAWRRWLASRKLAG
jgi:ABC-type transport system involved in cytochrome c biogenesis permease subunit